MKAKRKVKNIYESKSAYAIVYAMFDFDYLTKICIEVSIFYMPIDDQKNHVPHRLMSFMTCGIKKK